MILYGTNLSPFTRRVAIWCALQGRAVERRELAAMGPGYDEIRQHNPVGRVPVLVLDDGTNLIETFAICDYLDETAPSGRRLVPARGPARLDCLQRMAMGQATAEKAVTMVYERNRRPEELHWRDWQQRVAGQVQGGLAELDSQVPEQGWSGRTGPDGGDVAAVIAYQFVELTNRWLLEPGYPRLKALAERAMAIDAFAATKPSM